MDVISHGLWVGAIYKAINLEKRTKERLKVWKAVLWGIFPDVLSFAILFAYMIIGLIFGMNNFSGIPNPSQIEPHTVYSSNPIFHLTGILYNLSHSSLIFILVFAIISLLYWKPLWTMCAWGVHILIDIPTHSYEFYPTPVFWPISGWRFDGFSWANPWFLAMNYIVLIGIYIFLIRWERKLIRKIKIPIRRDNKRKTLHLIKNPLRRH